MGSCCSLFCKWLWDDDDDDDEPLLTRTILNTEPKFERAQEIVGAPVEKKWYHGRISNEEADYRLRVGANGHDGSYLVYDNPHKRGEYVLLVVHESKLFRWKISKRKTDGKYILGLDGPGVIGHISVRDLIHHHRGLRGKPIKLEAGGVLTLSKEYVYKA